VRVSGTPVKRRKAQRKGQNEDVPSYGRRAISTSSSSLAPSSAWAPSSARWFPVGKAAEHVFGYCLLNDWSARDIQAWEYQPLGPFLGKNFGTTVSPWVVTAEGWRPFRTAAYARPEGDPARCRISPTQRIKRTAGSTSRWKPIF